jgi:hypothetical protein
MMHLPNDLFSRLALSTRDGPDDGAGGFEPVNARGCLGVGHCLTLQYFDASLHEVLKRWNKSFSSTEYS